MNSEKIGAYASLSRPVNVAITFVSIPLASVLSGGGPQEWLPMLLGAVSGALVAAGANAINDAFDVEIDRINRPDRAIPCGALTVAQARGFWTVVSAAAVLLSAFINALSCGIVVGAIVLLYLYSARLKGTPLTGNLVVGFMTGMAFVFGGGVVGNAAWGVMPGVFALLANVSREVMKDVEDMVGDRQKGARTLPVRFGVRAALGTASAAIVLLIGSTVVAAAHHIYTALFLYIVLPVDGALLWVVTSLWRDHSPSALGRYSRVLKYCMVGGIAAIAAGSLG